MDVNASMVSDFILVNLFGRSGSHQILFSLVATMFVMGLLGNAVLLFLIHEDPRLHTPMYFLLSQLSLFDIGFPLVTIPKMASDFLRGEGSISFGGCAAQIFFLIMIGVAEGVLLALMSYDRYVAVCCPLQYPVLMRRQVCLLMVGSSWLAGVLIACIQTPITLHFPYCVPALLKLSCAVLRMRSEEARKKAFATCSSHITVVGLFYGAAVFIYMVPGAYHSPHQDNVVSLFYSLVTPTLNPLIYSLRNREVRVALVKVLSRAAFRLNR
uniref:G-protein coupled receptors family 1 profile domain-containing protein n=1 Tax=Cavia porcellus TaxID=10141 RepID=A0A286XW88_CAVPO